jgi:hypothetical protein
MKKIVCLLAILFVVSSQASHVWPEPEQPVCNSLEAVKSAIMTHIKVRHGQQTSMSQGYDDRNSNLEQRKIEFRFYPSNTPGYDCFGTYTVSSECVVRSVGTAVISGNGYEEVGETCWERATGPHDD